MMTTITASIKPNWRPGDPPPYRPGHTCTALGLSVSGKAPIHDLCRALVAAGVPDAPMSVMRDGRPSFRIVSIHQAAGWTVTEGEGRPRFVRYVPPEARYAHSSRVGAPHIRNSAQGATNPPESGAAHVRAS